MLVTLLMTLKSSLLKWKSMSESIKDLILQMETNVTTTNESLIQYCSKKQDEFLHKQGALQILVQSMTQEFKIKQCAMEQEKAQLLEIMKEKETAVVNYTEKYTG